MLKEIRVLLVEEEEAIQRLVSVKVSIANELARQVEEPPSKTLGSKKRKALSGMAQEELKAVTNLDQFQWEKLFGLPENPKPKKKAPEPDMKAEEPKDKTLVMTTKPPE